MYKQASPGWPHGHMWAMSTGHRCRRQDTWVQIQPHYFPAVWPWMSHFTSLSLNFLIYKLGRQCHSILFTIQSTVTWHIKSV